MIATNITTITFNTDDNFTVTLAEVPVWQKTESDKKRKERENFEKLLLDGLSKTEFKDVCSMPAWFEVEYSHQKITARLKPLVERGLVEKRKILNKTVYRLI